MTNAVTLASIANSGYLRNRIINGNMVIDQRNAGASVTPTSSGTYLLDRWKQFQSAASKFSVQQSSVAPPGFTNSLLVTSLAATSVAASDFYALDQVVEGFNMADFGWGTVGAQSVTLSFWVRSSLTGVFGGALCNGSANRSYAFSYTISAANTWEQKTITFAGDTTGTWASGNTAGINVQFGLGVGSTYSGTTGSWAGTYYISATGATSVVGTNGATFYITGVQLEVGTQATPFEWRPYPTELALCQRYYEKSYDTLVVPGTATGTGFCAFGGISGGVANVMATFPFCVEKRATPTVSVWDTAGNSNRATTIDGSASFTNNVSQAVPVQYTGTRNVTLRCSNGVAATQVAIAYHFTASAEL